MIPADLFWSNPRIFLLKVAGPTWREGNPGLCGALGAQSEVSTRWALCLGLENPLEAEGWLDGNGRAGEPLLARGRVGDEPRWWRLRVVAQTKADESVVDIEDVTAVQDAHERTRLEGQHFHALIERSAEGISLFDTGAKILWESPSNKRIHGWESWEMEGKNLFDFCHPDDMARAMPRFEHLAQAPGIVETEVVRFKHKEGHWIYLEGTVINATDDPRVGALVNNFREVTGRLEAEKELRRAKNAAEEAQRMQQHFLTNLSHEFKTPLTLIRGPLVDLAEGRVALTSAASVIGRVLRNVDRLDGLMSELMDLVKLDAGTFGLKINQHDLVEFVRRELDSFAPVVAEKSIRLDYEAPEGLVVFFDAPKLEKVVTNLVANAMRYSPVEGRVLVKIVTLEESSDASGRVRVSVRDEGPGLDESTRLRVFERFFQADTSMAREHEGMGIGLALAREMVEMHGGQVGVESEPGKGSTFWFELLLGGEHFDPDDIDTAAGAEPRPHTVGGVVATAKPVGLVEHAAHRPRLLLVEDNEDMRAYLRMNLDPYYQVSEAVDGRKAWEGMVDFDPEIIVSDVMMPHVDGLELCRRLKAEPRWREVPVLLLSAKGSVDHRVEGLEAGADDYVAKPFSVAELLQRLRSRVPWGVSADSKGQAWRERLETCVAENMARSEFDVGELAKTLAYSPRQLQRRVREHFGLSPSALLLQRRLERGRELLTAGPYETTAEVAHAIGLSPGYFSRRYRRMYHDA